MTIDPRLKSLAAGWAVFISVAACISPSVPLDTEKVGPSIRRTVLENKEYALLVRDELLPAVRLAETQCGACPASEVLLAMRLRLEKLAERGEDQIGRGQLLLMALDEAEGKKK